MVEFEWAIMSTNIGQVDKKTSTVKNGSKNN